MRRPPVLAALLCLACQPVQSAELAPPLPRTSADTVGLSRARLEDMGVHFQREVERGAAAGYVILVARDGKLVYERAIGNRDIERAAPMTLDTRFRIQSLTKPITAVAIMMLCDEGRLQLNDPVARFVPEFAQARVYTGTDSAGNLLTEPARRPITIRDLLTHTSGLGYTPGLTGAHPLAKTYAEFTARAAHTPLTLAEWNRELATLPLFFQPGDAWRYSYAYDVLSRIIEVVSGQPFDDFLAERLFRPLRMTATGFSVPDAERDLLATLYWHNGQETGVQPRPIAPDVVTPAPHGGAGLISTAGDYLRFLQMLQNGGILDGHRYLSPVTVGLMTTNAVSREAYATYWGPAWSGQGYGLGLSVDVDPAHEPYAALPGDFGWGGLYDTHAVSSPRSGIVAVIMTQVDPSGNKVAQRTATDFRNMVFGAVTSLDPPRKLITR